MLADLEVRFLEVELLDVIHQPSSRPLPHSLPQGKNFPRMDSTAFGGYSDPYVKVLPIASPSVRESSRSPALPCPSPSPSLRHSDLRSDFEERVSLGRGRRRKKRPPQGLSPALLLCNLKVSEEGVETSLPSKRGGKTESLSRLLVR
eukprot:755494-Hanusia_phi.AAC.8